MTAKTDQGFVIPVGRKEYYEIGYDLDGKQRMGSWQIKEIVDLSLQPRKKTEERFIKELPEGTRSAEVGVKVALWPSPGIELVVDMAMKEISFGSDAGLAGSPEPSIVQGRETQSIFFSSTL